MQQQIINVLIRTYNISPSDAYEIWCRARTKKDPRICEILDAMIKNSHNGQGIAVIINRNPSINYGSILSMHCVGYSDTLTMSVPLQILPLLAADFDGDVLNIFHIINDAFYERADRVFNPRNAMYISKVDGKMNKSLMVKRDTVINANTLFHLGEEDGNVEYQEVLGTILEKQKEYFLTDIPLD